MLKLKKNGNYFPVNVKKILGHFQKLLTDYLKNLFKNF